jgi:hypothetical protein
LGREKGQLKSNKVTCSFGETKWAIGDRKGWIGKKDVG